MDLKKFALCQHVANCDHFVAWVDAKILKMEPNYNKCCTAECNFINTRVSKVNVIEMMVQTCHLFMVCL